MIARLMGFKLYVALDAARRWNDRTFDSTDLRLSIIEVRYKSGKVRLLSLLRALDEQIEPDIAKRLTNCGNFKLKPYYRKGVRNR